MNERPLCVFGRFWDELPKRVISEEERAALLELLELEAAEEDEGEER